MVLNKNYTNILFVALLSVFSAHESLSQSEPSSGRMADGRAYRTDSQGVVMVDYIAELELETDSLRRQVQGLESELEEFRASTVSDRKIEAPAMQKVACPTTVCPEKICPAPVACPEFKPIVCPEVKSASNSDAKNCNQEANLISDLKSQIQELAVKEQQAFDKLNLALLQLNASKQREENISEENRTLRKQTATLASLNINKLPVTTTEQLITAPKLPAKNLVDSRNEFLVKVRSDLLSNVETLQSAVSKRNSKYQHFKSNYSGVVSFTPSKIEYDNSIQLDEIRSKIQSEISMRRLSEFSKQTNSLIEKVNFEIGMMDRLLSMKSPIQ